ncbi:MAG: DEAD/DEAH box helicase family protein, partial [Gammaproteobacteria bacterium]|nr:DEAD/DEAH box helicase family protein [Gammaproteobacteria bacterium]
EVDKFLAASTNSDVFASRILVAERQIARVGEQKIERAKPRCQILRLIEIDSWKNDWRKVIPDGIERLRIDLPKHDLRDYQREALDEIQDTFQAHDRGKLILPCGTGKSFVALKAAEENAGVAKTVLYLVPSISLMGQTMREWSRHRRIPHQYIGICSDVTTGKNQDLAAESYLAGQFSELCMPVTTEQEKITARLAQPVSSDCMRVVFCTYQSSVKIFAALKDERLRGFEFDLVICDEAHRTTGVESDKSKSLEGSPFQLIHDDEKISARKRLYMTATPRVFAENIRRRMEVASFDGQSYSMDDEDVYGPEAYRMSFADAINGGWLSDYRVVVIGVSEEEYLQRAENRPITFEDGTQVDPSTVVRLAGCWDALATPSSQELQPERDLGQLGEDGVPHARSAIAFTSRVKESQNAQKLWTSVAEWHKSKSPDPTKSYLSLDVDHLDAKTPASERVTYIESLRNAASDTQCRVLTNVGVLSEGVDVPALDAVVFLQSRSSPVDVTQAVGRVMRKATGKEFGYVVIPVVVPSFNDSDPGESAESLLSTSDFKPVWDVVRALRSHDERIDHMLEARTMPVVLRIPTGGPNGRGGNGRTGPEKDKEQLPLIDQMTKINERFGSLMLEACGDRHMYANWGAKAATVCQQIEIRLNSVIENHEEVRKNFESFHSSIQDSVSSDIDFDRTVRMVAHHLVTVPVFDQLFGESKFADRNPITQSMSTIIDSLDRIGVDFTSERAPLNRAYCLMNVAFRTASDPSKRLDVIRAIFDGFFRKAMPDEVKTMGIAYTPIEIVDFMIRFVDKLCRQEFGKGLTDRNVHILDPFVGTGTFIAHLLECKNEDGTYLIRDEDLNWKYAKELHANELVLLAYYIAALKIEETKHRRSMESTGATN